MERYRVVGLAGLLLGLVSLILPWFELTSIDGHLTTYGFSGDGVFSFLLLTISTGILFTQLKIWKRYLVALLALIALLISASTISNVVSSVSRFAGGGVYFIIGPGGPLMIVACFTFFISVWLWREARDSQGPASPSPAKP
ncbi:MAG: hypothetical protein QXF97_06430 [Candidatus Caldarchaeum sp.]